MTRGVAFLLLLAAAAPGRAADHDLFDQVLRAYVQDGRVDYPALGGDARFRQYLELLATTRVDDQQTDAEKLALVLNAANAFALETLLAHPEAARVIDIPGFFDEVGHRLGGRETTLDDVQAVVRAASDPRTGAALCNGAVGAPPLRSEAYVPQLLDAQLTAQARRWVNDPRQVRIDREARRLRVSRVFDWFRVDFEKAGGAAAFIKPLLESAEDQAWLEAGDFGVEYLKYDWTVNRQ